MNGSPTSSRSDRVDALKAFAIALVVLGHVLTIASYNGTLRPLYYAIANFNMPLFMFLSGFLLLGREGASPAAFLRGKFVRLMVPYFAWILFALARFQPPSAWVPALAKAAIDPHDPTRLWFLYVLFVFYVLFTAVRAVNKSDWLLVAAVVAAIGIAALPDGDYLGRANVQWLFTFFVAGYLLAKHRARLPVARPWMFAVAAAAFGVLLFVGRPPATGDLAPAWFLTASGLGTSMAGKVAALVWRNATAFAGIASTLLLYALLPAAWWRWQAPVGRSSLGVYAVHPWLLALSTGGTALDALVSWVVILYASFGIAVLLERSAVTRVLFLGMPSSPRRPVAERAEAAA